MKRNSIDKVLTLINVKICRAEQLTRNEIFDVVKKHIELYYEDYDPKIYRRTEKFLNSLIKTEITNNNGKYSCNVKISDEYLEYEYEGSSRWEYNIEATGQDVADWANKGMHGGTVFGKKQTRFWDDALEELGGKEGIKKMMIKNLKKVGL